MKLARTALFGAVSLALAAGSAVAAGNSKSRFDRLDANNDGVISRAEAAGSATVLSNFDRAFANNDAKRKPAKTAANNDRDPGFNALDRNNDGWVTRAEAAGNPHLAKRFNAADKDNDGKLNRAEYLATMAKKDVDTAKAKVDTRVDRESRASTGTTAPPQYSV